MKLQLRRTIPKSITHNKDLRRWGKKVRKYILEVREPKCPMGKLIDYGIHLGPVHYHDAPYFGDPKFKHTSGVLCFFPEHLFMVLFTEFVLNGDDQFKAARVGLPYIVYQQRLVEAIEIYNDVESHPLFSRKKQ